VLHHTGLASSMPALTLKEIQSTKLHLFYNSTGCYWCHGCSGNAGC